MTDLTVLDFTPRESDKIRSHRKENGGFLREYAVINLDTGRADITLRIYWPGTVAYACLWISHGAYARGAGKAGGGGYCKESAAVADALRDAGVKMSADIAGRGVGMVEDALIALAKHLNVSRPHIHKAHA